MPGLKFRGLAQRAVRAPNVTELYSGQTNTAPVATDFCNAGPGRTAAERAFCLQLGVPTQVIDVFQQENTQIRIITGEPKPGRRNLGYLVLGSRLSAAFPQQCDADPRLL